MATGGPRALEKDERLLLLFVARHDAAYSWARIVDTLGELRALLAEFGIAPARG